jgi:hypothetical protein
MADDCIAFRRETQPRRMVVCFHQPPSIPRIAVSLDLDDHTLGCLLEKGHED